MLEVNPFLDTRYYVSYHCRPNDEPNKFASCLRAPVFVREAAASFGALADSNRAGGARHDPIGEGASSVCVSEHEAIADGRAWGVDRPSPPPTRLRASVPEPLVETVPGHRWLTALIHPG